MNGGFKGGLKSLFEAIQNNPGIQVDKKS